MAESKEIKHNQPSLVSVACDGSQLVSSIAAYLRGITTQVTHIGELLTIVSITSSMLTTLDGFVSKFSAVVGQRASFIRLLCEDVSAAFEELNKTIEQAKERKVF